MEMKIENVGSVSDCEADENDDVGDLENLGVSVAMQEQEHPQTRLCIRCKSTANLFKNKHQKTCVNCLEGKPKRERTEKQKEAFAKAQENRKLKIQERKEQLGEIEQKAKSELENKIVKKAISIKKKQIKRSEVLDDEVSDDDTPLEEIVKIVKKRQVKAKVEKPKVERQPRERKIETHASYSPSVPVYSFC